MNATQVEAMLVRANAAHVLLREREIDGIDALRMIVIPTDETYEASMRVAQERGVSTWARQLAERRVEEPEPSPIPRRRRRRTRPTSYTLDEALAALR